MNPRRHRQRTPPILVDIEYDSWAGGICDIDESHIGNIGNALILNTPTAVTPFGAPPIANTLWASPPNFPPNATQTVLMQARSNAPGNPRNLVVGLNTISTQEQALTTFDADIKAYLQFGTGNDRNIAIVDFAQGLQVSLAATNIEVRAIYSLITIPALDILAGAQIAYGNRAAPPMRPTYTARYTDVAPGIPTSVNFIPPPFAREFYISTIDAVTFGSVAANITVTNGTSRLAVYTIPANDAIWRPLPNGARSINITNTGPNNISGTIIFGLGL